MVDVGDKVYWVEFYNIRVGTIVKKSWFKNKVWIRAVDNGSVFDVSLNLINHRYHTTEEDAIKSAIRDLKFDLEMAKRECSRVSDIENMISYWENVLSHKKNASV